MLHGEDLCSNALLPESLPTLKRNPHHYADIDGDGVFEAGMIGFDSEFTLTETGGCSCEQILNLKPGNNLGEDRRGCSRGTVEAFIEQRGWAD